MGLPSYLKDEQGPELRMDSASHRSQWLSVKATEKVVSPSEAIRLQNSKYPRLKPREQRPAGYVHILQIGGGPLAWPSGTSFQLSKSLLIIPGFNNLAHFDYYRVLEMGVKCM